ncbi:unnamed protein product [Ectocarpus sp. 13 AM-2016]
MERYVACQERLSNLSHDFPNHVGTRRQTVGLTLVPFDQKLLLVLPAVHYQRPQAQQMRDSSGYRTRCPRESQQNVQQSGAEHRAFAYVGTFKPILRVMLFCHLATTGTDA